jgi:propanol-preferring alcohol dehydrogenase
MRGLVYSGVNEMTVREFPDPVPAAGQVVVDIKATSICGSDLGTLYDPKHNRNLIMGHEGAGVVSALGPGVSKVKPGDRVALFHIVSCNKCKWCMAGYPQFCTEDRRALAGVEQGTDATKCLVKEENCLPLPDDVSFMVGAFIGCFAGTSFSAMKKLNPNGTNTVVVSGLGPVGLCGVMYAKAMGARVIGIDCIKIRLDLAKELGADEVINFREADVVKTLKAMTGGVGPDRLYETSGAIRAQMNLINAAATQGGMVCVGFPGHLGDQGDAKVLLYPMIGKELTIRGSSIMARQHHYEILDFIKAKNIDLERMITHRFPFDRIIEAIRLFETGETGKVVADVD